MPDSTLSASAETIRWQVGDQTKTNPFFILILNNVALERPYGSGTYVGDLAGSISGSPEKTAFTNQAEYIYRNLMGLLPNQMEKCLSDSPHASKIRIWSMYVGLLPNAASCLIEEDPVPGSKIISPRRNAVQAMLAHLGLDPDILFVVSNSNTHDRAAAYGTTDDDARPGWPFQYDGAGRHQRYYHRIPGMAAMHVTSNSMTAAHEFGHAFSSYSNGFITDLYVDGSAPADFNRKFARPIPANFATYAGIQYKSDVSRDGLGYPAGWTSYHPELADPANPALMDNFWYAQNNGLASRHDKLTKAFLMDRIDAKCTR